MTKKTHWIDYTSKATWTVLTLAQAGRLHESTHESDRYIWHVVRLFGVKQKNLRGHITETEHILYYSGEFGSSTRGVAFLVNMNINNCVFGCHPVSSRFISTYLRASPFNITIVQAFAPTRNRGDDQADGFYNQLPKVIDGGLKGYSHHTGRLVCQGGHSCTKRQGEPVCPVTSVSNEERLHQLELTRYKYMVLANTFDECNASWCWAWHAPNRTHHQIDFVMAQNRFRSGVRNDQTRTFTDVPDVGSDHDLVKLNFSSRLKRIKKIKNTGMKSILHRLKGLCIHKSFQATVCGVFAVLLTLGDGI